MPTFAITSKSPRPGRCSGCAAEIFWVQTVAGKAMCLDSFHPVGSQDGNLLIESAATHWSTCPKRQQFVRPKVKP